MSGGFFRGTSADQDTRFSNKAAKLLKSQKFAPELDQLVDMSKVNMDVMKPWIATRVTQLLGFEDEVLINFIYELLGGKNVDGKQIQIQITGFMEKNTGKFMKELWGLLTSAQNNISKIPQQFLDEKAEETRQKKAEELRVISEVRRKEEEKKEAEQARANNQDVSLVAAETPDTHTAKRSGSPIGDRSPYNGHVDASNRAKLSHSRSRSRSHLSSRSGSRSPSPLRKRYASHSVSRSPPRNWSRSPSRRRRSPINFRHHRSRSPRSPRCSNSLRRHHHSPTYARPLCEHSPHIGHRSTSRRRHSPISSHFPRRGRSPIAYSSRRHRSPSYPQGRKSPVRSPLRHHWRSPRYSRSSPQRYFSPPPRWHEVVDRSPRKYTDRSPQQRYRSPLVQNVDRPGQRDFDRSPRKRPKSSPQHGSPSPLSPPAVRSPSYEARAVSSSPRSPGSRSRTQRHILNRSLSPVQQCKQHYSVDSPSPMEHERLEHLQSQERKHFSYSPPARQCSPYSGAQRSRTPSMQTEKDRMDLDSRIGTQRTIERSRRAHSQSSDSREVSVHEEPNFDASFVTRQKRKNEPSQSVSKSSDDEDHPVRNRKEGEDKKAAKKRHREENRMRKKEKRRKREERHRRKAEKRGSKISSKEIASVTPPPDMGEKMRSEGFDTASEHRIEEEQRRIEEELRRKALESLRARKVISS